MYDFFFSVNRLTILNSLNSNWQIASETFKSGDFDEESSKKTGNVPLVSKAIESTGSELNERSDSPVMDFENDFKRNMEFYSTHANG